MSGIGFRILSGPADIRISDQKGITMKRRRKKIYVVGKKSSFSPLKIGFFLTFIVSKE